MCPPFCLSTLFNSFMTRTLKQGYGLIQIFTGDGKGKTTAALGEVIRSVGIGKKVGIVYFDKGGDMHYSERSVLEKLGVTIIVTGRDRIDPETGAFDFSVTDGDKEEVQRGLQEVSRLFKEGYDLVALDELNTVIGIEMVDVEKVIEVLRSRPQQTEVIITGRNATEEMRSEAQLVTEMRMIKHYYYAGIKARKGLDH